MSKNSELLSITRGYLDPLDPGLITEEQWMAEVIAAVANHLDGRENDPKYEQKDLYKELRKEVEAAIQNDDGDYDKITSQLCKLFNIADNTNTKSKLESLITNQVQRDPTNIANAKYSDITATNKPKKGIHNSREELRKLIWSPQGKEPEWIIKSIGWPTKTDAFSIPQFSQAKLDNDKREVFVPCATQEEAEALRDVLIGYKDISGEKIFKREDKKVYRDGEVVIRNSTINNGVTLSFKATSISSSAVLKLAKNLRESPMAYTAREDEVKSRLDRTTRTGLATLANTGFPVLPILAGALGTVLAATHSVIKFARVIPGSDLLCTAATTLLDASAASLRNGYSVLPRRVLKWGDDFLGDVSKAVSDSELKINKLSITNATQFITAPVGLAIGSAFRAISYGVNGLADKCNQIGDNLLNKVKKEQQNRAPGAQVVNFAPKVAMFIAAYGLKAGATCARIIGVPTRFVGDQFSNMAERLKDRNVEFFRDMGELGERCRDWTNKGRIPYIKRPDRNELFTSSSKPSGDDDVPHVLAAIKDKLNSTHGLKFDQDSGIKDDNMRYASLGDFRLKNTPYRILGGFDGETITIINMAKRSDNEKGKLPESIKTLIGSQDSRDEFVDIVTTTLDHVVDKESGISLSQFKDDPKSCLATKSEGMKMWGKKFTAQGYQCRLSDDGQVVGFVGKGGPVSPSLFDKSSELFNFAQDMLTQTVSVKSPRGTPVAPQKDLSFFVNV